MEEELAEKERAAGQTERGKGSIGPGCPGEEEPLLQKSPHQASSSRPGPLRGVLLHRGHPHGQKGLEQPRPGREAAFRLQDNLPNVW